MTAVAEVAGTAAFRELVQLQDGVVTHRQLRELGLTPTEARRWVRSGRWRTLHPGVYVTFTGPLPRRAEIWAAVLHGGPGAAASHQTALWLAGLEGELRRPIRVAVPHARRIVARPGVRFGRSRRLAGRVLAGAPPRVRVETALLQAVQDRDEEGAVTLVLAVLQQRLTTADRLGAELTAWPRHRWRRLLAGLIQDAIDGVASALERLYLHSVERAHQLPPAERNRPETAPQGTGTVYRDARYQAWDVLVELDGDVAHRNRRPNDLGRDNLSALADDAVLRYGWHAVAGSPCGVAAQVVAMLRKQGWIGAPRPCSTNCPVR